MKHAVAVAVLAAAACGAPPPASNAPAIVYPPCGPLVVAPPDDASPMQQAAVAAALESWNTLGFTRLSTTGDGEHIPLTFEKAAGFFRGLYEPETGIIYINSTLDDPRHIAVVVAHELGHAMGLPHLDDRPSVMKPGNLDIAPTPEDNALLIERCQP